MDKKVESCGQRGGGRPDGGPRGDGRKSKAIFLQPFKPIVRKMPRHAIPGGTPTPRVPGGVDDTTKNILVQFINLQTRDEVLAGAKKLKKCSGFSVGGSTKKKTKLVYLKDTKSLH
jgi:hypothetical protein